MLKVRVEPEWIDYASAERYSGLSHVTLWRRVKSGEIRAARVGRSVRIHLPSLAAFMEHASSKNAAGVSSTNGDDAKERSSRNDSSARTIISDR